MQPAFLRRHLGAACLMLAAGLASAAHADTGNVQRAIDWAQGQASVRHPASDERSPLVIAHRGASGYVPEHTLGAYALAVMMGADYVEPDLVMTRDGKLVARHDNELGLTTDVAQHPEFADRKRTQKVDGVELTGWFSEDFTLAELKTLRAIERIPTIRPGNARLDGTFEIPTLQEIIDLVKSLQISQQRTIGLYPEIKHGTHFQRLGLAMERPLVKTLHRNGYLGPRAPVFIQSFEVNNLKELKRLTGIRLVHLRQRPALRPAGCRRQPDLRRDGHRQGPAPGGALRLRGRSGQELRDSPRCQRQPRPADGDAHAAGLKVHPYTFRAENSFLPAEFRSADGNPQSRGDLAGEIRAYLDAGIDGLFSDQPDVAVRLREQR